MCQKLLAEGGELEPTEENLTAFAERNSYTDLGEEELLSYYEDTSYGAVYDYVNDYISGLEITKTESYEAIDVASFYPALLELRSAGNGRIFCRRFHSGGLSLRLTPGAERIRSGCFCIKMIK